MEAHRIPYIATANAVYSLDLYQKVRKAKEIRGSGSFMYLRPARQGGASLPVTPLESVNWLWKQDWWYSARLRTVFSILPQPANLWPARVI